MSRSRSALPALFGIALAITGLQLIAPPAANAVSSGLVIREVYGGGGNASAPYNADFVELYNPTGSGISLTGLGLQIRTTGGGGGGVTALSGSVPAGQPFLVQMTDPGANGSALPTPDQVASPAVNMASTNGQVLLLPTTTGFTGTGDVAGNAALIDMVGYGDAGTPVNNTFETAPSTPSLSNTTSASRTAPFTDTDNNSTDFTAGAPTPEASDPVVTPTLTVTAPAMTYGKSSVVSVNVSSSGSAPTGTVQIKRGSAVLGTGTLSGDQANITLPARSLTPGTLALTAAYPGDPGNEPANQAFSLKVNKATPKVRGKDKPKVVEAGKTKAKVVVKVKAPGVVPVNGKVRIKVPSQGKTTLKLVNGRVVFKLDKFANPGKRTVTIKYLGNTLVSGGSDKVVVNVKP